MWSEYKEKECTDALRTALMALKQARKLCDEIGWDGDEIYFNLKESHELAQVAFDCIRQSTKLDLS